MDAIRLVQIPKIGRKIGQKYGNFEKFFEFVLEKSYVLTISYSDYLPPPFYFPKWAHLYFHSKYLLCNDSKGQVHCVVKLWKIDKIAKSDIVVSNRNIHRKRNRHFWLSNLIFYYCTYNKGQSMQGWKSIDFNRWFYEVLKCSRTKKNTLYSHKIWTRIVHYECKHDFRVWSKSDVMTKFDVTFSNPQTNGGGSTTAPHQSCNAMFSLTKCWNFGLKSCLIKI